MDFSTLTRRELQALCKKNGIPANITNVAMADSLQALEHVEGLEDLLNQSPEKTMIGSVSAARTAGRTTTRRKPIKEPESSQTLTTSRRGRRTVTEEMDQEKNEVPKTPVAPSTRRRAPPVSARQKTETQKDTALVQSVYSTRRSVRLLEKNMSKLNLDSENSMSLKMGELSTDIDNCSEKSDGSVCKGSDKVTGSDKQTASEMISERVDVSEVQSEIEPNGPVENEGQLKNDAEENNKTDPKSELDSEVAGSKSTLDVIVVSELMDESSYGEGSDETDEKDSYDKGTESSLGAEVSDATEVMDLETATLSSLLEEVNESLSEEKSTEPNLHALTINLSGEQGILASKSSAMYGADADYNPKFDFESESVTEEECSEDEATDEKPIVCSKGSDIHGEEGKFDESDSMTEEDSDGSSTEGESGEEGSDGSSTEGESGEEGSDGDEEQASEDEAMDDKPFDLQGRDDVHIATQLNPLSDEMQTSAKPMSHQMPYPHSDNQVATMQESNKSEAAPALAAEQIANQFPRPAFSTPGKSAGKKQSEILNYIFDDNEENIEGDDKKDVETKKAGDATNKEDIAQMSLRQLKKMLKSKMNVGDDKTKMEEKPRTALQEVPENLVAVNKVVNGN